MDMELNFNIVTGRNARIACLAYKVIRNSIQWFDPSQFNSFGKKTNTSVVF